MKSNYTFSRQQQRDGRTISGVKLAAVGFLAVLLLSGGVWVGYRMGVEASIADREILGDYKSLLAAHQLSQRASQQRVGKHLDALALRLGTIQSELYRLEALGGELAKAGNLNLEEFDFSEVPPMGGVIENHEARTLGLDELSQEIDRLARSLDDRAHKLALMQGMILGERVLGELEPRGKPVRRGWISSNYGYRTDPFTGKKNFHHGVDIAGKKNSEILAMASGVVTEAERKSGYGFLVEITHADGLVTKYAHNSKIFVKVGELVTKGQVIGQMGSTGRSTGPHVHFEISRNGKTINPKKYLNMN